MILLAGCAAGARNVSTTPVPLTVREVQALERELGFEATPNFKRRASEAFEHCYYTGLLRLPEDYSGLWFKRGQDGSCPLNERKYDIVYYAPEALAGRATAVTPALEQAAAARRTFVISHEDFHDQPGIRALPAALKEAASTLAGFLVEWEQSRPADARRDFPAPAAIAFLEKAKLVNRAHAALSDIYKGHRAGTTARRSALLDKRQVFTRLAENCGEGPAPEAFAPCPAAFNNAGLAFEATYTKLYPEVFALYEAAGWDVRETLSALLVELPALEGLDAKPRAALAELAQKLREAR